MCRHLAEAPPRLPLQAVLRYATVPDAASDYRWDLTVKLCTFCAGFMTARLLVALDDETVGATTTEP